MTIGAIGFLIPWLLWTLLVLPLLWILLRAIPPAPVRRHFPALVLLLGLQDKESTADTTPWWLLLIRLAAVAAAIVAFAGPVLNPQDRTRGNGPLLVALDASWASAQDWSLRQEKLQELLRQATADDRPVAVIRLTDTPKSDAALPFAPASDWAARVDGLTPQAWAPNYAAWQDVLTAAAGGLGDIVWFTDGLDHAGRTNIADVLGGASLTIYEGRENRLALRPLRFEDGVLKATVVRRSAGKEETVSLGAIGPDPAGITRQLASAEARFENSAIQADAVFDLPTELRNRVKQVELTEVRSAGTVTLTDDSLKRRKVALLGNKAADEGGILLSGLHYLRKALLPTADVIEAELESALLASPDVLIFDDIGALTDLEMSGVEAWVREGGTLLRFAGPRLIASGLGQDEEDMLLPVRLRAGGRSVGGAMSWGDPKKLAAFPETSPFFGLPVPEEVTVSAQVVAQPGPGLADRVLASLEDGTPLVTAKPLDEGRVILVHVTANADWSNLPISGLFVQMLERLAISAKPRQAEAKDLIGLTWVLETELTGFGALRDAPGFGGVPGETLAQGPLGADLPPGVYAYQDRRVAKNVISDDTVLEPVIWPSGQPILNFQISDERDLKPWVLLIALGLMLLDILATLLVSGRFWGRGSTGPVTALFAIAFFTFMPSPLSAQQSNLEATLLAANNTVLAYVKTGDANLDETSQAGLLGLSAELFRRTAIEPLEPVGVDLERDELALFPFIYWPVSEEQNNLSPKAFANLNRFLRNGGMLMLDTRDANLSRSLGSGTPNGRALQRIAAALDIPRIEPIPQDHVLTRAFYLLQDFPGRYAQTAVWVEAAPADAERAEGMPFRNLNDGVSPVVIGANDWAAAWAVDEDGRFQFPVGRGINGERQREISYRFGINLLMYVMTGNYKSDQVHVPALLDRLGQ